MLSSPPELERREGEVRRGREGAVEGRGDGVREEWREEALQVIEVQVEVNIVE